MSSFSFIKPKNQLWKDAKISKIQARIMEKITELPHTIRTNKHNMELLSMVCNMIENSGIENKKKNNNLKIDKKLLLIQIYKELYGTLSPADCEQYDKNIEFLYDNGHIIKHKYLKRVAYSIYDWFERKILN